jgi:hypothetical protein
MGNTGLLPTQATVKAPKVNSFAQQMANGTWDWTRIDRRNLILLGPGNEILSGHHRFIAATLAGVEIPESAITRLSKALRPTRPWAEVVVEA